MKEGDARKDQTRRRVSRRRFVGEAAIGAAGLAGIGAQAACSSDASGQTNGLRSFVLPNRFEWKRREVHPRANRGWADTHFTAPAVGVPSTITVFDRALNTTDFAEALLDVSAELDVVYAFWDGTFVRQRELGAPLAALADRLGASLPTTDRPFVIARSQSRSDLFAGAPEGVAERITEPASRYRVTFPRSVAVDSGAVIFDFAGELLFYALAVEGYGARAFVKYFESVTGADEYEGPEDTGLDDYLVANIPVDDFLDLDSDERVEVLPTWA